MKKKTNIFRFLSLLLNPLIIIIFYLFFSNFHKVALYGGKNNLNAVIMWFGVLVTWFILSIILNVIFIRKKELSPKKSLFYKIVSIVLIVMFFGNGTIYTSKVYNDVYKETKGNLESYLKRQLMSLDNDIEVIKIKNDNVFNSGINEFFEKINIQNRIDNVYVKNDLRIFFDTDGKIIELTTTLSGKAGKGKYKDCKISYNAKKSNTIIVESIALDDIVSIKYEEKAYKEKKLSIFIEMINKIPLKQTVNNWDEELMGILYSGNREWDFGSNGLKYINKNKKVEDIEVTYSKKNPRVFCISLCT